MNYCPDCGGIVRLESEGPFNRHKCTCCGIVHYENPKPCVTAVIIHDQKILLTKRIIEWGETGACFIFDDYGYKKGLFMSPRNYRKYVFPWLEQICKTAHKGGLKILLHSCGDVNLIFEDIINSGIDAINPIEPTTVNPEFDIYKLNEKYKDKITLVGNVSPQDLAYKNPQYIRNSVKKLIKHIAPGGGYILSSGHSINPSVKLENFLAMREALKKYEAYPISIE